MNFHQLVDKRRKQLGLTNAVIATHVGFENPQMVSMVAKGKSSMSPSRIPALAAILELDPADLYRSYLLTREPVHYKLIHSLLLKKPNDETNREDGRK